MIQQDVPPVSIDILIKGMIHLLTAEDYCEQVWRGEGRKEKPDKSLALEKLTGCVGDYGLRI